MRQNSKVHCRVCCDSRSFWNLRRNHEATVSCDGHSNAHTTQKIALVFKGSSPESRSGLQEPTPPHWKRFSARRFSGTRVMGFAFSWQTHISNSVDSDEEGNILRNHQGHHAKVMDDSRRLYKDQDLVRVSPRETERGR